MTDLAKFWLKGLSAEAQRYDLEHSEGRIMFRMRVDRITQNMKASAIWQVAREINPAQCRGTSRAAATFSLASGIIDLARNDWAI